MKTIRINRAELINELTTALEYAGSTDWDIYVDMDGNVDTCHNTHSNGDWVEIIDLYYCEVDPDSDCKETAEWIVSQRDFLTEEYEIWCEDEIDFIPVTFDIVG